MDLKDINKRIIDRTNVFYWQAERKISEEEAAFIWKDRHRGIDNDTLLKRVNEKLDGCKCLSIDEVDPNKQESLGNVNSNRVGHLDNGKDVIIRCHPKGVKNGYFYVESLVAKTLLEQGLPSYKTYVINELKNEKDFAFQVIEKINGKAVQKYLETNPDEEEKIVLDMGKTLAKMHNIEVEGFGPFDNEKAKKGKLKGICKTFYEFMVAGLDFDLDTLVKYKIISKTQVLKIKKLFNQDNPLLQCKQAVLVHNDFADWNALTDGNKINGIIDLDECIAADPICDVACWSTFFDIKRTEKFLKGYFEIRKKESNFEEKFQLFRLRYNLSKMTLRVRRYTYSKDEFIKLKIEQGKEHLKEGFSYFKIK